MTHTRTRHLLRSADGSLAVTVDESGSRIASIRHLPTDTELLLQVPWNPDEEPTEPREDSNQHWHERFAGGWHTLLPNAGDARVVDGVTHPFHGEAAWRLWTTIAADESSCTLSVDLQTVPLRITRTTSATDTGVIVDVTVENFSDTEVNFTWTEHPSFNEQILDPAARVWVGDELTEATFPERGESHSGFRSAPVEGPGIGRIAGPDGEATLTWDEKIFPYAQVWQEHRSVADFPWFGKTSTAAIEPASRAYDATEPVLGPIVLGPGESLRTSLGLAFQPGPARTA